MLAGLVEPRKAHQQSSKRYV